MVLVILFFVIVWMRVFCFYLIMFGMSFVIWVIFVICRFWCRSVNGLVDGIFFFGVCVFSF